MAQAQYAKISPDLKSHASSPEEWQKGTEATVFKSHPHLPEPPPFSKGLGIPGKWVVSIRVDDQGNLLLKKEGL